MIVDGYLFIKIIRKLKIFFRNSGVFLKNFLRFLQISVAYKQIIILRNGENGDVIHKLIFNITHNFAGGEFGFGQFDLIKMVRLTN